MEVGSVVRRLLWLWAAAGKDDDGTRWTEMEDVADLRRGKEGTELTG
jgi:hypothetical protein